MTAENANPPRAQGIDVSHWKSVSSWQKVFDAGNSFVGIKASEGPTYVDPALRGHRDGSRQQPFLISIYYHFARSGDAAKQGERLLDSVGQLRDNERLALDLEVPVTAKPSDTIAWVDEFFDIITEAYPDRRALIYTSERIWRSIGNPDWERAADIDLWAPRYSAAEPVLPKPWLERGWLIWQRDDRAIVPGVDGPCDGNVFYSDAVELHRYAALTPTPTHAT